MDATETRMPTHERAARVYSLELTLFYDQHAPNRGLYRYVDTAGVAHDWGSFSIRALGPHKGQGGFTVTCRSEKAVADEA